MKYCFTGEKICIPETKRPRVVVVGGGFAGMALVKRLKNKPVQVVLIDRNNFHMFQPLLYQVATCGIEPDNIAFPLRKQFNGYRNFLFRMAQVQAIDPEHNNLLTDIGEIDYDFLVLATGSCNNFFGMKQVAEKALGMKTVQQALDIRSMLLQNLEKAVVTCDMDERDALTNFVIVGGGPAGVETAGALAEFKKYIVPKDYPELDTSLMKIYLVEAGPRLLPALSGKASESAYRSLQRMGVIIRLNTLVSDYDGKYVNVKDGNPILSRGVIWTAGVNGQAPAGLREETLSRGKRLKTDRFNRVEGYDNIFAIGDLAYMPTEDYHNGHPMVAQVALQQGKNLGKNLLRHLQGKPMVPFEYKDKGSLATIGRKRAVAEIGNLKTNGYFAWLLWSVVHLVSISGFRNKLQVGLNWLWSYLTYDQGNRLIIRKFTIEDEANHPVKPNILSNPKIKSS